jgi:hypothetical protein
MIKMSEQDWHLSRSVPISLIFAIACQTVALIWFVATLRNDVDSNKTELVRLETRTDKLEQIVQGQAVTMGRMDENIKAIREAVEIMARSTN